MTPMSISSLATILFNFGETYHDDAFKIACAEGDFHMINVMAGFDDEKNNKHLIDAALLACLNNQFHIYNSMKFQLECVSSVHMKTVFSLLGPEHLCASPYVSNYFFLVPSREKFETYVKRCGNIHYSIVTPWCILNGFDELALKLLNLISEVRGEGFDWVADWFDYFHMSYLGKFEIRRRTLFHLLQRGILQWLPFVCEYFNQKQQKQESKIDMIDFICVEGIYKSVNTRDSILKILRYVKISEKFEFYLRNVKISKGSGVVSNLIKVRHLIQRFENKIKNQIFAKVMFSWCQLKNKPFKNLFDISKSVVRECLNHGVAHKFFKHHVKTNKYVQIRQSKCLKLFDVLKRYLCGDIIQYCISAYLTYDER